MVVRASISTRNLSWMFHVDLGLLWVLVSPGNELDIMIFVPVRVFTLLFIESDCVHLHFACSVNRSMSTLTP